MRSEKFLSFLSYFYMTKRRVQGGEATSERRRRDGVYQKSSEMLLSKISMPIYVQHISYIIVQTSYAPAASAFLFLYFRLIFCDIIIKNHLCRVIWHEVIFICTAVLLSHL